jgi:hypothetical protein
LHGVAIGNYALPQCLYPRQKKKDPAFEARFFRLACPYPLRGLRFRFRFKGDSPKANPKGLTKKRKLKILNPRYFEPPCGK